MNFEISVFSNGNQWQAEINETTVQGEKIATVVTAESQTHPEQAVSAVLQAYRRRWPEGTRFPKPLLAKWAMDDDCEELSQ